MRVSVIQYRNKDDFVFGSWHIRTGAGWMEISGRLKKTGKETVFTRLEYSHGHGKTITIMDYEEE